VTGFELTGLAENGLIHLINSGAASLDATGEMKEDGKPVMKPFWEISDTDIEKCLKATTWYPAMTEYFRGGGYSSCFITKGGMPMTMSRINLIKGLGPVLQLAEGWTVDLPLEVHEQLNERTNPTWPTHWFTPRLTGKGAFKDVYSGWRTGVPIMAR
jgi:L-fucose isomerase